MKGSRIVFITGATSGFGEACARRFAEEGAKLILCGRRTERLKKLKKELEAAKSPLPPGAPYAEATGACVRNSHPEPWRRVEGGVREKRQAPNSNPSPRPSPKGRGSNIHTLTLDVRDRKAVFAAVKNLPKAFAAIDVLVNNAGLALGLGPAHEADLADWDQMIDTNVKGLIYCTRAVLPGMVKRNRGHIINMGSIAGTYPYPGGNVYGATKAFVEQFSLNLRADLLGKSIRVTNIEPGLAETEFSLTRFHGDQKRAAAVYKGVQPLTADDVAEAVHWAASLPAHVNINRIELMPVMQASAGFAVHRE